MTYHPRSETRERLEKRDAQIREWWAMGLSRQEIAERVDLTPQRVWQIATGYVKGGAVTDLNRQRPTS